VKGKYGAYGSNFEEIVFAHNLKIAYESQIFLPPTLIVGAVATEMNVQRY
jgi:hypothetical protein